MPETLTVMVSSTARDLPEHREQVKEACLRQGMLPKMMEHLPASDAEAIAASLKLVDEADIYVGIFAHRYGYVPAGHDISITEMEYNRAVERQIPRLIFVMDKTHPITIEDVEQGEGALKLKAFKERVQTQNIVNFFSSPADLRAEVVNSLSQLRQPDLTTFHYVSDIPEPPEPFIAHPYTLLQTHRLVGRQPELNLLTDWVARPDSDVYRTRILNVVAVGGLGKSALTWHWFQTIAPQEMKPLAGRLWWSFYESDATFENFVTRALAYVSGRPLAEVQQIPAPGRESQLLAALDREPFLLVLDGLERILIAYARMDAARLEDSQVGSQKNLRKTADPRAGRFLKRLAQVRGSRILVSTRLYPADLETEGGDPTPGSFRLDIEGLTDEDAVELWRTLGITGSRDLLLPVFDTFGRHPLLIQALAGEVKRFRRDPGNFEEWCKTNPRFDPTRFPLLQDAMAHVLEFALRGLNGKAQRALQIIAAFIMPASYDTLSALLISEGKVCADERELDAVLTELEDRGLVGWERRTNRYDPHPIVRGMVWSGVDSKSRENVHDALYEYFSSVPSTRWKDVKRIDDLTPGIELYNALINLKHFDAAFEIFQTRLEKAMMNRLGVCRYAAELLEPLLFGTMRSDIFTKRNDAVDALARAYYHSGRVKAAVELYRQNAAGGSDAGLEEAVIRASHLGMILRHYGALRDSEYNSRKAASIGREQGNPLWEGSGLEYWGWSLAARGAMAEAERVLHLGLSIFMVEGFTRAAGLVNCYLSQFELWRGNYESAIGRATKAQELALAKDRQYEHDLIVAARLQGEASLRLGDLIYARRRLHEALSRARSIYFIQEELHALISLAELRRREGDAKAARELLDDVWEAAERGPYPLVHADACNVLAEVERDEGNGEKAVEAAERAYRLAWCDGPPYAYHWGLERARALLRELGAGEPEMPAFDESKFEPMPEVEIDPPEEEEEIDRDGQDEED